MRKLALGVLALVSALLDVRPASATILFIDLNFNPKEIATAREAARLRGEDLLVIPQVSPSDSVAIQKLKREIDKAQAEKRSTDARERLLIYLNQRGIVKSSLGQAQIPSLITATLTELEKSGRSLSSLIISGHHGGTSYSGLAGSLGDHEIPELFGKFPAVTAELGSAYLWGCYTGTKGQAKLWSEFRATAFPNLRVMAGFSEQGPKEDKALNHEFLKQVLLREKEATGLADTRKLLDSINGIKTSTGTITTFCDSSGAYVSRDETLELSEAIRCDEAAVRRYREESYPQITKYLEATDPGYLDVPANTHQSPLRTIYTQGKHLEHCFNAGTEEDNAIAMAISRRCLMLIFHKTVLANVELAAKPELTAARNLLSRLGHPKLLPDDFSKLTRAGTMQVVKNFEAMHRDLAKNLSDSDREILRKAGTVLRFLKSLTPSSPLEWVESSPISELRSSLRIDAPPSRIIAVPTDDAAAEKKKQSTGTPDQQQ